MVLPRGDDSRNKSDTSGSSSSGSTSGAGGGPIGRVDGGAIGGVRAFGNALGLPAIEKLKGRINYSSWSFSMKMILIREGTWRAVKPIEGQALNPEMDERALAAICLSLEKNNFSLVKNARTAEDAWNRLEKAFQDDGLNRRCGLLNKLTSVNLEDFGSVEDYVDELVTTTDSLNEIGFEVNDQWLASLLLKGLPSFYAPMIMGIEICYRLATSVKKG